MTSAASSARWAAAPASPRRSPGPTRLPAPARPAPRCRPRRWRPAGSSKTAPRHPVGPRRTPVGPRSECPADPASARPKPGGRKARLRVPCRSSPWRRAACPRRSRGSRRGERRLPGRPRGAPTGLALRPRGRGRARVDARPARRQGRQPRRDVPPRASRTRRVHDRGPRPARPTTTTGSGLSKRHGRRDPPRDSPAGARDGQALG